MLLKHEIAMYVDSQTWVGDPSSYIARPATT
jgi:hypothetical protein